MAKKTIDKREKSGKAKNTARKETKKISSNPLASIVILTLNNLDYTKQCIESVFRFSPKNIELIVVDNGSNDSTPTYLKSLSKKDERVKIILNGENLGYAKGNNQGIKVSKRDCIVLLNNDTVVTEGWLERMIEVTKRDPLIGLVGPCSNYVSGPQFVGTYYGNDLVSMQKFAKKLAGNNRTDYQEITRLVGFCMLIKREVIEKIGLLDEQFELGNFEDDDFCRRAIGAGYKLAWATGTFVHHWGSRTFASEELDYAKLLSENQEKFNRKWNIKTEKEAPLTVSGPSLYYEYARPEVADLVPFGTERVLDVGCGAGVFGESLKAKGVKEVVGIELNPDAAHKAEMRLDGILVGDVENIEIPWHKRYFDCITVNDVLEHLRDPWNALLKLKEYLKEDGFLIGSIPNISHISIIKDLLAGRWSYQAAGILDRSHLRFFTIPETKKMLQDAGFEITETRMVSDNLDPVAEQLSNLLSELGIENKNFLTDSNVIQMIFVAKNKVRKLSLAMIARNEEVLLPRCLESVKDVVDEIVVVDTGSTDSTIEIAKSYGAKVIEHEWKADFSEARNVSLDAASGDWVMFLDADEELVPEDREKLRGLLTDNTYDGFEFSIVSLLGAEEGYHSASNKALRMWRNRPQYRFHDPIHEQILDRLMANEAMIKSTDIRIKHYGYLIKTVERQNKTKRNIEIVEKTVKENPRNAFAHYNLAMEYLRINENEKALGELKQAFKCLPSLNLSYAPQVIYKLSATLATLDQIKESLDVIDNGLEAYPSFTDLMFLKGKILLDQNDTDEAQKSFEQCLKMGDAGQYFLSETGVGSFKALHMLGETLEKKGQVAEAVLAYTKAFQNEPSYYPVLHNLGKIMLDSDDPQSVKGFFEKHMDVNSFENLLELSDVFLKADLFEDAISYLNKAREIRSGEHLVNFKAGQIEFIRKNYEISQEYFSKIPQESELYESATLSRALALILTKQIKDAKGLLSPFENDYPQAAVYMWLISILDGKGSVIDPKEYESSYLSKISSATWGLLMHLAKLEEYELFEKALDLLKFLDLPKGFSALNLGKIYFETGARDLASELLLLALSENYYDDESLISLGSIAEEKELLTEAESFYKSAIEAAKKNLSGYSSLLNLQVKESRYEDAIKTIKQAQKFFPDAKLLKDTLNKLEQLTQNNRAKTITD